MTVGYDFWYYLSDLLPNSVDLYNLYIGIVFSFNNLHQVLVGIEIALVKVK